MYTDEDLERAIKKGIFNETSVAAFRQDSATSSNTHTADEENIRLVASFNDIFVVIASGLLLYSVGLAVSEINRLAATALVAIMSWALTEIFVLKRKMALPAITLLITFVIATFMAVVLLTKDILPDHAFMLAALASSVATWFHWQRFRVPITVAAGAVTVVFFAIFLLRTIVPSSEGYLSPMIFLSGLTVFYTAMRWDLTDLQRVSSKSDVAFWLHMAAAPLLVHPVFLSLGYETTEMVAMVLLYLLLIFISLIIDRRAFMVSALIYVIVALSELFSDYGLASSGNSTTYVGIIISCSLLLLSGFWREARKMVVMRLPTTIQQKIPAVT